MTQLEPTPGAKPRPTDLQRRRDGELTMAAGEAAGDRHVYRLGEMIVAMADELASLRAALAFYAEPASYGEPRLPTFIEPCWPAVLADSGGRARHALGLVVQGVGAGPFVASVEAASALMAAKADPATRAAIDRKYRELDPEQPFAGEIQNPRERR